MDTLSRLSRRRIPIAVGVMISVTLGCGQTPGADSQLRRLESALIVGQVDGPETAGPMPSIPGGPANVSTGAMSTAVHLAGPPTEMGAGWQANVNADAFTTPPAMATYLQEALAEVNAALEESKPEVPELLMELSEWVHELELGGPATTETLGYIPERARWVSETASPSETTQFDPPAETLELRSRGRNLYCAAVNAQHHQFPILGRMSLLNMNLFGQRLRFMSLEPTATLAPPLRFDGQGAEDGAQAYVLPFAAGVRLTPVSFLPSLPELRTPVFMLTAQSQVSNRADVQGDSHTEWTTFSHADGFGATQREIGSLEVGPVVLFSVGLLEVTLGVELSAQTATCANATGASQCFEQGPTQVGRLLSGQPGVPSRDGGRTIPNAGLGITFLYNDSAWEVLDSNGIFEAQAVNGHEGTSMRMGLEDPFAARAMQNNDKALDLLTSTSATVRLAAGTPELQVGPLHIEMAVSGGMTLTGSVAHRFREREETQIFRPSSDEFPQFDHPLTAFTITPTVQGDVSVSTEARLNIGLVVPLLGSIERSVRLWNESRDLGRFGGEGWPEANRVRLHTTLRGEDGSYVKATQSHWYQKAFSTYGPAPDGTDCEGANVTEVTLPPPCEPTSPGPVDAAVPHAELCFYHESLNMPDPRAHHVACEAALAPWRAAGVAKSQPLGDMSGAPSVWARVVDLGDEADVQALSAALNVCAAAYADAPPGPESVPFDRLINWQVCSADATLQDEIMVLEAPEDGSPPAGGEGSPSACHP